MLQNTKMRIKIGGSGSRSPVPLKQGIGLLFRPISSLNSHALNGFANLGVALSGTAPLEKPLSLILDPALDNFSHSLMLTVVASAFQPLNAGFDFRNFLQGKHANTFPSTRKIIKGPST